MSTLKKNKQLVFAYNPHNKYGTNKLTSVPNWDKVVKITLILQNINLIQNEVSEIDGILSLNNHLNVTKKNIFQIKQDSIKDQQFLIY